MHQIFICVPHEILTIVRLIPTCESERSRTESSCSSKSTNAFLYIHMDDLKSVQAFTPGMERKREQKRFCIFGFIICHLTGGPTLPWSIFTSLVAHSGCWLEPQFPQKLSNLDRHCNKHPRLRMISNSIAHSCTSYQVTCTVLARTSAGWQQPIEQNSNGSALIVF